MKFTLSWLRTHLDTHADLDAITDRLTAIGLELEGVADPGAALSAFRVAHVLDAQPHPNADRLRVCRVDTGAGEATVVCGAPNARTGMKTVFAPPGATVPATGAVLKVGEIRGVKSEGMLVSFREMGLGDDHEGIVDLPDDAPVGTPYPAWAGLDDPVIEISVTPNRGDALSVRGVARDLAAAGLGTLRPWVADAVPSTFASPVRWANAMPSACVWALGRTIRGVRNGPSPEWLQRRLISIGLRPINALVDVTNFFTHDIGRPLHVFDADRITGGVLTFQPGAGEPLHALNGRAYVLDPADCAIADAAGAQSLAGVIGGEATGCQNETTSVFLECALFDPVYVALAGRRHNLVSDARQRFERGIDPALLPAATEAATRMILELCGGEASEVVAAGEEPAWQRRATLRFERLRTLGGADVPADEAASALHSLGFTEQSRTTERITVSVPSWRNDVAAPIALDQADSLDTASARTAAEGCAAVEAEADLVEEVLRLHGLDSIAPVSLPRAAPVPGATLTPAQARAGLARRTLAAGGFVECVTFSFMAQREAALFGDAPESARLLNPIASDLDQLRPTPVATLATAAARNAARGLGDARLFEVGPAFAGLLQQPVAAGLLAGHTPRHPLVPSRPVGAADAKAAVMDVLQALGLPMESLSVTPDAPGFYHPGRSGVVRQGPKVVLGTFGDLHPRVADGLGLAGPAAAFEVFLHAVPEPKRRKRVGPDLPSFQPVRRDFAFVLDGAVPVDNVLRAARGADRALVSGVSVFDVYEGEHVAPGQKSVAVEVVFQPRERTLTDAELEAASAKVVAAVNKATGGVLR